MTHFSQFFIIHKNQNTDLKTEIVVFRQDFDSNISLLGVHCKVSIPISMLPGRLSQ